ncbi:hypothetical protein [Paraburkholderia sp. MM5482-R1]|uniref:hypothetical protein n=1 Tax=Paraburkholderia sp. MM5482-R1 TaxID=2991063 RepID=UPI003D24A6AC
MATPKRSCQSGMFGCHIFCSGMPTEYCHSPSGDGVCAKTTPGTQAIAPKVAATSEPAAMPVCLWRGMAPRFFLRLLTTGSLQFRSSR